MYAAFILMSRLEAELSIYIGTWFFFWVSTGTKLRASAGYEI